MAEPRYWNLVVYDVRDDKRLRRVHRVCSSWGRPVQLSVFRVRGTARELARLEHELAKILTEGDRLMIVPLCGGCAGRIVVKGETLAPFDLELPACKIC